MVNLNNFSSLSINRGTASSCFPRLHPGKPQRVLDQDCGEWQFRETVWQWPLGSLHLTPKSKLRRRASWSPTSWLSTIEQKRSTITNTFHSTVCHAWVQRSEWKLGMEEMKACFFLWRKQQPHRHPHKCHTFIFCHQQHYESKDDHYWELIANSAS